MVVIVRAGKIVWIGVKGETTYARGAKIIDCTGKYLLPGLIDLHVHYHWWMGELFLSHGVTTVKDVGSDTEWIESVSGDEAAGRLRGPRVFYVGNGLDAPPPARFTHVAVDSVEIARRAVGLLHERGACAIKVREKITPEILGTIVERAHELKMPVTGHLRRTDALEAARAGIDGLEHTTGVVQAIARRPRVLQEGETDATAFLADMKAFSRISPDKVDGLVRVLAESKVALIPTIITFWAVATPRRNSFELEDAGYARNADLSYVPEDIRKQWTDSPWYKVAGPRDMPQVKEGYENFKVLLRKPLLAGGRVLAGSDTSFAIPGLSLIRELALIVDAGFTPLQAISIGTRDNARFLGQGNTLGSIERGKIADLIIVGADPLRDLLNLRKVEMVIKNGLIVDTSYHSDYSVPTPEPKLTRPRWLERALKPLDDGRR